MQHHPDIPGPVRRDENPPFPERGDEARCRTGKAVRVGDDDVGLHALPVYPQPAEADQRIRAPGRAPVILSQAIILFPAASFLAAAPIRARSGTRG